MKVFGILVLALAMAQSVNARHGHDNSRNPGQNWLNDEQVISKTLDLHKQGRGQLLPIRQQLGISAAYRGEMIKSVIVIAKTKAGRGNMHVLANGSSLDRKIVGTELAAYEMPVNLVIGRGVRQLQLETNGNFLIQSIMVVLSKGGSVPQMLTVEATVNRFGFNLEAETTEQILRQCMQEVRSLKRQRPGFQVRRVTANGVAMRSTRGNPTTIHEACQFIADQAQ